MFNNLNETLDYIYSFTNLENTINSRIASHSYNLNNIRLILDKLGNPQNNFKIFHIAGTKGKGSVSFYISALLEKSEHTVMTFMSPHLITPLERILYNLKNIDEKTFIEAAFTLKTEMTIANLNPTTFEAFFAIFLLIAAKLKPDYLVVETGLGGRLDTTNIIYPVVSVITKLGLDHTEYLGKRLSDIAYEKGGIIKQGSIAVIAPQKPSLKMILKKIADERGSRFYYSKDIFKAKSIRYTVNGVEYTIVSHADKSIALKNLFTGIYGAIQLDNLITALAAVHLYEKNIIKKIADLQIKGSIAGRFTVLRKNPLIIVDTAHNPESGKALASILKKHFPLIKKWNLLTTMAADKDYKKFYKELLPITDEITIVPINAYKKSNESAILSHLRVLHNHVKLENNTDKAFCEAVDSSKPLLVTGSFYICGPFLEYFSKR